MLKFYYDKYGGVKLLVNFFIVAFHPIFVFHTFSTLLVHMGFSQARLIQVQVKCKTHHSLQLSMLISLQLTMPIQNDQCVSKWMEIILKCIRRKRFPIKNASNSFVLVYDSYKVIQIWVKSLNVSDLFARFCCAHCTRQISNFLAF